MSATHRHNQPIPISIDDLERLAFESGHTVERRGDNVLLTFPSGRRFIARLDEPKVPEQREPGAGS